MKQEDKAILFWLGFGVTTAAALIRLFVWVYGLIMANLDVIEAFFRLVAVTILGTGLLIAVYVMTIKFVSYLRQRRDDRAYNSSETGIFANALDRGTYLKKELSALTLKLDNVLALNKDEVITYQTALRGAKVGDKWAADIWTQIDEVNGRSKTIAQNQRLIIERIRNIDSDITMLDYQFRRCKSQGTTSPSALENLRRLQRRHDVLEGYIKEWHLENPEVLWFFINGDDDDFLDLSGDTEPTVPPRVKIVDILNKAAF
ncbi:hypothetical protein [Neolewinella persica]|uniref:hypothetical protein n=1 Tax=Neolewinella persica TaxID=70998 RepID=UPI000381A502|nr:hypothetical protein [Neolewinella persica]